MVPLEGPRLGAWAAGQMEVLAALLIGERPPGLLPGDLEEIVDVERPDPHAVTARRC